MINLSGINLGVPGTQDTTHAVLYTPQTLTEEHQAQARQNIGASDGKTADNLTSWAERAEREVVDEWSEKVRTTAGSLSIDSSKKAYVLTLKSKGAFKATNISASGANLLNPEAKVGDAYVFLVSVMRRGEYGVSNEANGIVFCDNAGNMLHPTVRFSETYPTSASDGVAVTPYQFSGHSEYFYPSNSIGYFIVSDLGVTANHACARVAWSKNYNKFEAYVAPSSVSFASAIAAIAQPHSTLIDKMLAIGSLSDEVVFNGSTAAWTRRLNAVIPEWTDTPDNEGNYRHSATISDIKSGGVAETLTGISLEVNDTEVSFVDNNATCELAIKYELATVATGTVSQSNQYQPNDFGIEFLVDAEGEFIIRTSYYQGVPDSVYATIEKTETLEAERDATLGNLDELGDVHAKSLDMDELPKVAHYDMIVKGSGAPTTTPDFIGQRYIDTANKKSYDACGVGSVSDWIANN